MSIISATDRKKLLKAMGLRDEAQQILADLAGKLQEAYDRKSETWQEGDKGCEFLDLIGEIEQARDDIENVEIPEVPDDN